MGTEASFTLDHSLSTLELATLPEQLNQRFRHPGAPLELRWHLGYRGTVVLENASWIWREDEDRDDSFERERDEREWEWFVSANGGASEPMPSDTSGSDFLELLRRGRLSAVGPFCLTLYPSQHAVDVSTQVNWDYFVLHDVVQSDLLQVGRGMGQVLRSRTMIIYPDDIEPMCGISEMVRAGRTLNSVLDELQAAPATEIREMIETVEIQGQQCCEAKGFYLERLVRPEG